MYKLRAASLADAAALLSLLNEAYEVERGDAGPAFKNTGRYESTAEVEDVLRGSAVTVAEAACGRLVGAISYSVVDGGEAMYFGPFAVATDVQGQGIGRQLRAHVEEEAAKAGCKRLKVRSVRTRETVHVNGSARERCRHVQGC